MTGRVQGVFFRAWTREIARELDLGGTVRNLPDGSVVAHFVGPAGAVEQMAVRLWEGPPASRVDAVEPVDSPTALQRGSFRILQ